MSERTWLLESIDKNTSIAGNLQQDGSHQTTSKVAFRPCHPNERRQANVLARVVDVGRIMVLELRRVPHGVGDPGFAADVVIGDDSFQHHDNGHSRDVEQYNGVKDSLFICELSKVRKVVEGNGPLALRSSLGVLGLDVHRRRHAAGAASNFCFDAT